MRAAKAQLRGPASTGERSAISDLRERPETVLIRRPS
jgi:hypothetical protein